MRSTRTLASAASVGIALAVALTGCGGGSTTTGSTAAGGMKVPDLKPLDKLGTPEGVVNVLSWPGYVVKDKDTDWVTPFEQQTGCKVNNTDMTTSDQAVAQMKTGQFDVLSASGDATLRLIASGDVEPINTGLITNYPDIFDGLKNKSWNSVGGVMYGVPHGRGANLLMYRTDKVVPAPDSWGAVFDQVGAQKGHVTAYDSPIYIADAAVYLMATKPDLKIKDPYALDQTQFKAAVDLLKAQKANVSEYWSDVTKEVGAFKAGSTTIGTSWQYGANLAAADKAPVAAVLPKEGATGWSDTWMVGTKSAHKTCAYKFIDYIVSPKVNAQIAEYFGEAPANRKACDMTQDKAFCTTYHATDETYFSKVYYWNTPIRTCLDGRTDVQCVDYAEWTKAWTEIRNS